MLMKAGTLSNQGTGNLIEKYASAVCHWRGRINFLNDEGVAVKGSDFDCVLVYFGDRLDLFKKLLSNAEQSQQSKIVTAASTINTLLLQRFRLLRKYKKSLLSLLQLPALKKSRK
jgi:hypothetical protein